MSMWDDTPTTLTVFGPLSSEVSEGGNLFTRLWKRNKDDSSSSSHASSQKSSRDPSVDREASKRRFSVPPRVDNSEVTGVVTEIIDDDFEESVTVSTSEVDQQHGDADRTLSSVLNRLSNILERRTTTPQAYRDSDFKQFWMPDSSCKECYDCGDKFTTFRRRHHCRICGQIFCSKCCNQELPGKIIGYKGGIRVCTYCGKVAMSALQNEPSTGDLRVEREDLRLSMEYSDPGGPMGANSIWGSSKKPGSANKLRSRLSMTSSTTSLDQMAPFDLTPQTDYQNFENLYIDRKFLEDSVPLRELWKHIADLDKGVEMQSHRIRLRTYHKCIVGNKLVDWLIKNDRAVRRVQAVVIGQALLDAGYLEPASGQQPLVFQDDFTLYKPSETSPMDQPEEFLPGVDDSSIENTEPEWLQQIEMDSDGDSVSEEHAEKLDSFQASGVGRKHKDVTSQASSRDKTTGDEEEILDFEPLPRQDNHGSGVQEDIITDSVFTSSQTQSGNQLLSSCRGWRNLEQVKDENDEKASFVTLKSLHEDHLRGLVSQMLCDEGLSKSWMDIVLGTAQRVSKYVHPDVKHAGDHMDIRKYIKFKKIPGGNKEQTCVIHGLVFTKNVAHKKMAHQLTNPTILLLKGSIEYQRVESKFSSLEPQILQEEEFLRKNVSKISSMKPKPHIVVVEKSVSRLAQNFLLASGITLLYNVKLAVMERLERFTQATIISSIDGIVSGPINLGFCHNFKARNFSLPSGENKTMLCFDGCATHLGCTISLRGGSSSELKRIKKIMRHIIYAAYNSQLEISLCMDEFAMPPGQLDDSIHVGVTDSTDSTPSGEVDIVDSIINIDAIQEWVESTVAEGGASENVGVANEELGVANGNVGGVNCSIDGSISSNLASVNDKSDEKSDRYPQVIALENKKDSMSTEEIGRCSENANQSDHKDKNSHILENATDTVMENDLKTLVEEGKIKFTLGEMDDDHGQDQEKNESLDPKMDLLNCNILGRQTSSSELITDQSDPLHNFEKNQDDTIFQSSITLQEKSQKRYQKFRKLLNEVLLSTSPFVKYDVPFLESESGSECCSRKYFTHIDELYWSCRFDPAGYDIRRSQKYHEGEQPPKPPMSWSDVEVVEAHPFILSELTSMDRGKTESMLADFRARGGRIVLKPTIPNPVWGPRDSQQNNTRISFSGKKDRRRDCLEFHRHQRLAVLLSSHSEKSANHPFPCLPPQIVTMEFYGNQDITLGGFLEKFCFRESYSLQPYTCPSEACDVPMLDHVRRIVHNSGAIYISLRKLKNCVPGGDSAIMMWNWCRKCRQATPLMPMSQDTWNISFAKYLELHFYGNSFMRRVKSETCTHSLHQTFSQYFGHKNIVATFKYYGITKLEIALPHCVINLETGSYQHHLTRLREETKHLVTRGTDMYSTVLEYVLRINAESQNEMLSRMVGDYITMIQTDKCDIREQGRSILDKLQALEKDLNIWGTVDTNVRQLDKVGGFYLLQDDLVRVKRSYSDSVSNWNIKLQELYSQHKKRQMVLTKKDREMSTLPADEVSSQAKYAKSSSASEDGSYPGNASLNGAMETRPPSNGGAGGSRLSAYSHASSEPVPIETNITETQESDVFVEEQTGEFLLVSHLMSSNQTEYVMSPTPGVGLGISPGMAAGITQDSTPPTNTEFNSSNSYIVLQVNKDNTAPDAERKGHGDSKSYNLPTVAMEVEDSLSLAETDVQKLRFGKVSNRLVVPGNSQKLSNSSDDQTDGQQTDRISGFKKTITNFLSGTGLTPLVLPADPSEHTVLPSCYRVPILVYDQEPSSIIAYALSCHDYHQKLQEIQATIGSSQRDSSSQSIYKGNKSGDVDSAASDNDKGMRKGGTGMLAFLRGGSKEASPVLPRKPMDVAAMDSVKYTPKLDSESIEIEEERAFLMSASLSLGGADSDKSKGGKQLSSPHLELQFSDQTARFYCKVYFAEQFQQLRKLIFPAGEDMFIRSLSRCKVWEAKGGKSGSAFSKTDDDRFILKQMSGIEVDIFEKFGPEYFQHVSMCYMEQKPTALAKIVGVYRIGFRNTHTNRALKQDVLIMENLFYNRKISQTFDLKGSNRNRLVNTSGKREEEVVLLDENLMKLSVESPLYVYPHSKNVLNMAIKRDSEFLSSNLVMDYSLLVGLDEKRNELVVGIIDYIRTFTWDKKLETLIKSTGGKMPTVVSPEIYRTRFMEAMGRYFLPVPDQWYGLGRDTEL